MRDQIEIVGAQQLEGAGHLAGVEKALLPHHVLEEGDLAFVDEQRQLAGFREVGLRRKQGERRETVVADRAPWRRRDREQRAAQAIADGVHLARRARCADGIERGHRPERAVVLHAEIAVVSVPGSSRRS